MKRIFFLMLNLCMLNIVIAQNQEMIATFTATTGSENGYDISEWVNSTGVYTVFYRTNGDLYMANVSRKNDTQSWGRVREFDNQHYPETSTQYEMDVFTFKWYYSNDYDSKTGVCTCTLSKIYKAQGVISELKMITESLDVIIYTGYLDGSLNF